MASARRVRALRLPPWPGGISRPRSLRRVSPARMSGRLPRWVWCHRSQSGNCKIHHGERANCLPGGRSTTAVCKHSSVFQAHPNPEMPPPGCRPREQRGQKPLRRGWSPCLSPALGKSLSPLLPLIRGWVSLPAALGAVGFQREVGKRSQPDPPLLGSVISNRKKSFPSPSYSA